MWTVSEGFTAAVKAGHQTAVIEVVDLSGNHLSIASGRVEMDSRRSITRTCELEITPWGDLDLDDLYDLVMTPSWEVRVSRGVLVDGAPELVPLGIFSTDTVARPRDKGGVLRWSGSDRARKISRAKLDDIWGVFEINVGSEMEYLLRDRWPYIEVDLSNVTEQFGARPPVLEGGESSDPWAECRAILADFGYDLAFDGLGVARATPIPDPADIDVVSFDYGAGETNLVTSADLVGSFDRTYNGVIVTAESSGNPQPVRGEVWDDNPASPTYYLGTWGKAPTFISTSTLTTSTQCVRAARAILSRVKGRAEQLSWDAVVMPALVPLDTVSLTVDGRTSRLMIDKLSIPLSASEPMAAIARETSRL